MASTIFTSDTLPRVRLSRKSSIAASLEAVREPVTLNSFIREARFRVGLPSGLAQAGSRLDAERNAFRLTLVLSAGSRPRAARGSRKSEVGCASSARRGEGLQAESAAGKSEWLVPSTSPADTRTSVRSRLCHFGLLLAAARRAGRRPVAGAARMDARPRRRRSSTRPRPSGSRPSLAHLSPGERIAVAKLLEVGRIFQDVYEQQRHRNALAVRAALARRTDPHGRGPLHPLPAQPGADRDHSRQQARAVRSPSPTRRRARTSIPGT